MVLATAGLGTEWWLDALGGGQLQGAIDLVGADVIKTTLDGIVITSGFVALRHCEGGTTEATRRLFDWKEKIHIMLV